jgi:hypothetical protein
MDEVNLVEIVKLVKGHDKMNLHGYLMTKDKNRDDLYYWNCESKRALNCSGKACTLLINDKHYLRKSTEHNHSTNTKRAGIAKACHNIKEMTRY